MLNKNENVLSVEEEMFLEHLREQGTGTSGDHSREVWASIFGDLNQKIEAINEDWAYVPASKIFELANETELNYLKEYFPEKERTLFDNHPCETACDVRREWQRLCSLEYIAELSDAELLTESNRELQDRFRF